MSSDPLVEAATRFRDAEAALREVIGAAELLRSVQDDLKDAAQSLGTSERALRDSGDAVYQLASEMKEVARDLATGVDILKKAGVQELGQRQQVIQEDQARLAGRVNLAVVFAGIAVLLMATTTLLTLVK